MTATINASTTAGVVTTADTSGILQLQTNGTAALTIDASANVGIGTASPATNLQVTNTSATTNATVTPVTVQAMTSGTAANGFGSSIEFNAEASDGTAYAQTTISSLWTDATAATRSSALTFATRTSAGAITERMRIDSSGNVGIGTSSPTYKLDVSTAKNTTNLKLSSTGLSSADDYTQLSFGDASNIYGAIRLGYNNPSSTAASYFAFYNHTGSSLTEKARINSSGSTFFNCTASPTSNSTGPGGLNALISSGDVFNIKHTADGNNVFNIWQTGTASFNAITFFKGGSQTGIGQILGTTSSTAYQTSSDYRLKENITPMTGALDKVAQLKPVTYKWKVDGSDGQGFIAHELQAVVPDCVSGEKDQVNEDGSIKPQGIDTSFLVATLTAAIQEQQAMISQQADAIQTLTNRISALEAV